MAENHPIHHFELRLERHLQKGRTAPPIQEPDTLWLVPEIWIDGNRLDEPHAVSVNAVLQSFARPGLRRGGRDWHEIFTCGCGDAGCANTDEGIAAVHGEDTVDWVFRRPQANKYGSDPLGYRQWCEAASWHQFRFDRHQVNRALMRFLDEAWELLTTSSVNIGERCQVLGWFYDDPRATMRYRSDGLYGSTEHESFRRQSHGNQAN